MSEYLSFRSQQPQKAVTTQSRSLFDIGACNCHDAMPADILLCNETDTDAEQW